MGKPLLSKPLLSNYYSSGANSTNGKSVMNPVGQINMPVSCALITFPTDIVLKLKTCMLSYTKNMAERKYSSIPTDISTYIELLLRLSEYTKNNSNDNLITLFTIATQGLTGSMNANFLFNENLELTVKIALLNKKIEEILSNKNNKSILDTTVTGGFTAKRTFKLAPLYSFYISIFGLPVYGVGFDPVKLQILLKILNDNGIKPYD
jgi:hypothetical protein